MASPSNAATFVLFFGILHRSWRNAGPVRVIKKRNRLNGSILCSGNDEKRGCQEQHYPLHCTFSGGDSAGDRESGEQGPAGRQLTTSDFRQYFMDRKRRLELARSTTKQNERLASTQQQQQQQQHVVLRGLRKRRGEIVFATSG
ncbi:hypothetical protein K0M31_013477 [Melipona bicolor]|uniref:Uncharacterized protein n=1 Tax=Melipona bicolor TaxID=60889 RepID=A0AA40FHP5_9HYME|nr:hypothetical protein K0M31_013477 [Melipona bicolor]